ncbi:hypothetical protein [Streptomyces sp. CRN 30]|uniref:hypothetical protein n=1 Tax=Streptomyces sp. CRN 30 TaxID=3075613 RepID=UPI002A83DB04|nr:hypothetical protein [Streptomyces sp. CRN 30]
MSNAEFRPGTPQAKIYRNQAWTSGNGRAVLRLQEDGNFVLYKDNKAAWQGAGSYPSGQYAVMQDDGNLVVYAEGDKPVWASNTNGNYGAVLVVQDDCNVCLYVSGRPIWATNTAG